MKALFCIYFIFFLKISNLKADDTICKGNKDKDSLKHGVWLCAINKIKIKTERYKHGVLQNWILYNAKGEIIETRNKKGKIRKYNPCGC